MMHAQTVSDYLHTHIRPHPTSTAVLSNFPNRYLEDPEDRTHSFICLFPFLYLLLLHSSQYILIERNTLFFSVMSIMRLRNLEIRFAKLFIFFILLWIKCRLEFYCLNNFHELIIFTPEVFYMFVYMWTVNKEQYLSFKVETIGPFIRGKIRRVLNKTRSFRINGTFRLK